VALFFRADLRLLRGDALASVFYFNNWHQILADRSYFEHFARPSLLQHFWSLSMEEQFYLVWPAVEKFFKRAWVVPLLLVLVVLWQLCNFGYFADLLTWVYGGPAGPIRPIFLITFTPILLGVLAAHAMHDPKTGIMLARWLGNRWIPPLLLVVAGLACEFTSQLQGITRLTVHVVFCGLLLAMIVNPHGIFSRTLQSRPMSYLGKISYGIYLYHTLILWAVGRLCESRHIVLTPFELFLVVAPLAIGLAGLSFRFYESPIMSRRHRPPQPVAAGAAS
jgi:peptidoglycan/LPS O-acetylase OafA/YrhL